MVPVYTDKLTEYQILRTGCALIDYADAGLVRVSGPEAAEFLGDVSTRTVDFLLEGQVASALTLADDGSVIAELLIYCHGNGYVIELWPAQRDAALAHLHKAADRHDVVLEDVSLATSAVFGLEGPESFRVIQKFMPFSVASIAYRSFATTTWHENVSLVVARTGVSGEFGYKIHAPLEHAAALRAELLALGAVECGVDALDVCRLEMRFVNLEREGGATPFTPFDIGLQWMVDFSHDFIGKAALLARWEAGLERLPVCWIADEDVDTVPASGTTLTAAGTEIGAVTHAEWSPGLHRVFGTARVNLTVAAAGLQFGIADQTHAVRTVSAPFLVPASFGIALE
jgi:aminomethyltransferase